MSSQDFSKEFRLLKPAHFEHVFADATPAVSPQITALGRKNQISYPRLGITIPKKRVRKASDRNRIKRLVRESFRTNKQNLPNIDIVIIGKSGLDKLDNNEVFLILDKLWKKLKKRCANQ